MTEIRNSSSSLGSHPKPRGEACAVRFNRVQADENGVVTRYAVNNLNQYIQVGQFAPSHDRNGNLSGMGQWLYRYDALNRLVFASNGTTTARFYYDAKNRCVARSYQSAGSALQAPSSTLTLNTYDNWNLVEERDGSGAQQARYVHGRRIDEIIVMMNKHGTFYPHHDALGNVTMLTGQDGRLVERYTYSVTGQVSISDAVGKSLTESTVGNRWMFTGREWLQEVGLYDYRNRVYSADLGRFLQTDPIRFEANDSNLYRYVSNGYIGAIDPFGLAEINVIVTTVEGITHVSYQGTYDDNSTFTLGFYPNGVQDDTDRTTGVTPTQTFSGLSDSEVRDGFISFRLGAMDGYSATENNCGNAVDAGINGAGLYSPDYGRGVSQASLKVWDRWQ